MVSVNRQTAFFQIFKAESGTALILCLLVTPIIAVTNFTASVSLILLHAAVITCFVSVCSSVMVWLVPLPSKCRLVTIIAVRIVVIVVSTAVALPIISVLSGVPLSLLASRPLLAALVPVISAYVILALFRTLNAEREKALHLKVAEAEAMWQALSAQIRPHFLFNCLNGLEQLVDSAPDRAQANIRALAAMYRAVLDASEKKRVPLHEEIALVLAYLQLQQMRYAQRLQYRIDTPGAFNDETQNGPLFPATLLLSLVENAVKHGIEHLAQGGCIAIDIVRQHQQLVATVTNPVNPRAVTDSRGGHGTRDIQQRLALLFGEKASYLLQIENSTAKATIQVPWEMPS
ncbi:MAG: histidine kinase [Deltaproteobacteria bacterium]|nr:histidine kinase [Deltaproteobacteria bacterium]